MDAQNYNYSFGRENEKHIWIKDAVKNLHHNANIENIISAERSITALGGRLGTKSDLYKVTFSEDGKSSEDYLVKFYKPTALDTMGRKVDKDYFTEKAVLETANNITPQIFSKLLYSDEDHMMLVLEGIKKGTIESVISKEKFFLPSMIKWLEPTIAMHEVLSKHQKEIETKLDVVSNGAISRIHEPEKPDYERDISRYLKILGDHGVYNPLNAVYRKNEIIDAITNERLYCLIQADGYPWHTTEKGNTGTFKLLDAGVIDKGSRAINLACLICHPTVLTKMNNVKEDIKMIISAYAERAKNYNADFSLENSEIEKAIFPAAVYAILRETAGILKARKIPSLYHPKQYIKNNLEWVDKIINSF